ncbi:hypothetical protein BDR05DRAFT_948319 [Suillus weaverae]|nr:hypothetical protein BDR05DRAFT_948319 [Suillus weaverae]
MLLDPSQKDSHIKHFWDKVTHAKALEEAKQIFKEEHIKLYGEHGVLSSLKKKSGKGVNGQQYPVWASLTHDHLSIMATSVLTLELALEELDDREEGGCDDHIILSECIHSNFNLVAVFTNPNTIRQHYMKKLDFDWNRVQKMMIKNEHLNTQAQILNLFQLLDRKKTGNWTRP